MPVYEAVGSLTLHVRPPHVDNVTDEYVTVGFVEPHPLLHQLHHLNTVIKPACTCVDECVSEH